MKTFSILFFMGLSSLSSIAQPLFTIGNTSITKADFLRAYHKNKATTANKQQAMQEYLDLYINFKLKVKAAQELKIDTLSQINYDVQNFRTQVIENYLTDELALQDLINEAAQRADRDIQVNYFFIPVAANATPTDTLKAYTAINELYNTLKKQPYNPTAIAAEFTKKYSLTKFADAGFVTVFTLPYAMENKVYNTTIGSISSPLKTGKGWFIFKPIAKRAAMGKWKIAQLLFAYPPDADAAKKSSIKAKADSVYSLLNNGLTFEDAAVKYSDDRTSAGNGGVLQEFGAGAYQPDFEKNVIAIKADGEITKPFETTFGYHIVKRISRSKTPVDSFSNEIQYDIKQQIMQDERVEIVKTNFVNQVTKKTGFKKVMGITNDMFYKVADSVTKGIDADKNKLCIAFATKNIIQFVDKSAIKGSQWIEYVKTNSQLEGLSNTGFEKALSDFYKQQTITYYKENIEKYNPEFKNQMQEFKEGNMLFEIMEQKIWSKAGQDTELLKKFYDNNLTKYTWAESADVVIFHTNTVAKANEAIADLKNGTTWAAIVQKSDNQIQADSGRYELTQITGLSPTSKITVGTTSAISSNPVEGDANFAYFIKAYPANMQRNFTDAKGLVINDYQSLLEKQWITDLRKKYPVKINTALFNEITK